jgi:hypothetical protein
MPFYTSRYLRNRVSGVGFIQSKNLEIAYLGKGKKEAPGRGFSEGIRVSFLF